MPWAVLLLLLASGVQESSVHAADTATTTLSQSASLPTGTASYTKSESVSYSGTETYTVTETFSETMTKSLVEFTHLRLDFSSTGFHQGDEVRVRISTVVHTSSNTVPVIHSDTFLPFLNASAPGASVDFRMFEVGVVDSSVTTTCASLVASSSQPYFSSIEFGVKEGEPVDHQYTPSAHFTTYIPATNFTFCVKYNDPQFIFPDENTWLMLQYNTESYATSSTPSGTWYFTPSPPRVRMLVPVDPSAGDYAPLGFVSDGTFGFTLSSTECNTSSSDSACGVGDSAKIVPAGSPCTIETYTGGVYVGANLVSPGGAWSTSGLARYHEGTYAGGVGRIAEGTALPFSTTTQTAQAAAGGTVYGYFRLPDGPGEYEICYSAQTQRAEVYSAQLNSTYTNVTVSEQIEALPVWTKVFLCEASDTCLYSANTSIFTVLNATMGWTMYDLTPQSWGTIKFSGDNLRRVPSQVATTLTPTGDAFRIVPNSAQDASFLVYPACFGTAAMTVSGAAYDGGATLTGDPTNPEDQSLSSNTTYGEAFVPASGDYIVCYRKWNEYGKWRVLSYDATPHEVLGGMNYSSNLLTPGVYANSLQRRRPFLAWELLSNLTYAETETPVVINAVYGGRVDSRSWTGFHGTILRVVPYNRGCAGDQTNSDLTDHFSSDCVDGGEEECSVEQLLAGLPCKGRFENGMIDRVFFQVRMPVQTSPATNRICVKMAWLNWISPPHISELSLNSNPSLSSLSGTSLELLAKPTLSLASKGMLENMEKIVYFSDLSGNLSTNDIVSFIPSFRTFDIGELVEVIGPPLAGQNIVWTLKPGMTGLVWEVTIEGYRMSFPDHQGGWRNAIFPPSSLKLEVQECSLSRKYFNANQIDSSLQPYCQKLGAGVPATAGIMYPPCSLMPNVASFCAPHTLKECNTSRLMKDITKHSTDGSDDVVPLDSVASNLHGVAAVISVPKYAFSELSICYKGSNAGWLRMQEGGSGWTTGTHFKSVRLTTNVVPAPGRRLISAKHQQFSLSPSIAFDSIRAKFVPDQANVLNANCLQPPAGTVTNHAASYVKVKSSVFSVLLPSEGGSFWFCFQILLTPTDTSDTWMRVGPYTLEATGIHWRSSGQLLNMGTANIELARTNGLFNINPGADMTKIVLANDTCHATGVSGIGPLLSTPVQKLVTDLGPTDGLNSDASFVITLPPVAGDVPAIYHVCVYTFFVATSESAWVEVSHASGGLFVTKGSDIKGWTLHNSIIPQYDLGFVNKKLAVAGASTLLPSAEYGFVISFAKPKFVPINFKFVKIGGPKLRIPANSDGQGWKWEFNSDALRGCDPIGVHGTMSDDNCLGSTCTSGEYVGGHRNYSVALTLPDVGVYLVCLRFGNDSWLLVPAENGDNHLYTVPSYLQFERVRATNISVEDLRVSGPTASSMASWCSGYACGDKLKFAGWGEVCTPPPTNHTKALSQGWFDLSSWNRVASTIAFHDSNQKVTAFNFPPDNFYSTVVKVCLFKSSDYGDVAARMMSLPPTNSTLNGTIDANSTNGSNLGMGNGNSINGTNSSNGTNTTAPPAPILPYIANKDVVYTLWNRGDPAEGGGSVYWKPQGVVETLLVTSKFDLTQPLTLNPGELIEFTVQPALQNVPVILQGVVYMSLCSDVVCTALSADQPFVVNNVAGCYGAPATQYGWEPWGRRQNLNLLGQATFRFTISSNCPPFGCLVRFYAKLGGAVVWSDVISILSGEIGIPDGVTVNDKEVPTCTAITDTCNVTISCIHNEECPVVIAARKNGPRLYAASGFITLSHPPLEKNISTLGFGNPKIKAWNSKGVATFILTPIVIPGVLRESVVLDIVLPVVGTKITIHITRRVPAMALISGVLPLDTQNNSHSFRVTGKVPVPVWLPLTSRSQPKASSSSFLVAATGSYLQIGVPYELRFSVFAEGVIKVGVSDKWLIRLSVSAPGTTVTDLNGAELGWQPPVAAHNSSELGIVFMVQGGTGCSRLNTNKPSLGKALGQGCDFFVHINDTVLGIKLVSTLRTPVRIPATTVRVIVPGDSLFNASMQPSNGNIRAPIQTGVQVTVIPGTFVFGEFVNDEFHYGGIFSLFGANGLDHMGVRMTDADPAKGVLVKKYPLSTVSQVINTKTSEVQGVWAASWTLKTDRACAGCVFSFHSEGGASPDSLQSFLTADFYDETTKLKCTASSQKVQWKSDSFESESFSVVVEPHNAAGVNTVWPRLVVSLVELGVVTAGTLSLTEAGSSITPVYDKLGVQVQATSSGQKVIQATMQLVNGRAVAVFQLKAYGVVPTIQTLFTSTITTSLAQPDGTFKPILCEFAALLIPLRVSPTVSFGIDSFAVTGATPLCAQCQNIGSTCLCNQWLTDPVVHKRVEFKVLFFNTTSLATVRNYQNYNISVRVGAAFPLWTCDSLGRGATCITSSAMRLQKRYVDIAGYDDLHTEQHYEYGDYGPVHFEKHAQQYHTAYRGEGVISLIPADPTPARDVSFEICTVFPRSSVSPLEALDTAVGCIQVRLWATPEAPRVLSIGLASVDLSFHVVGADPSFVALNSGGEVAFARQNAGSRVQQCGYHPSRIRFVAMVYFTMPGKLQRYCIYDRSVVVTVEHGYPAARLVPNNVPEARVRTNASAASPLASYTTLSQRFVHDLPPSTAVEFSVLNEVQAASFTLYGATKGADILSYTTLARYSAGHVTPGKYTSLQVANKVVSVERCPSTTTMACAINSYLTSCPDAGMGWEYVPAKVGLPFPLQVSVENNELRRSWSYPDSLVLVESVPATMGCGDGGVFNLLKVNPSLDHISHPVDSFVTTEATQVTGGIGLSWVQFSEPCQFCVLKFTLCDPDTLSKAACLISGLTELPNGPPLVSRVRITKPFSIEKSQANKVVVSSQILPNLGTTPLGQTIVQVGSAFTLTFSSVTEMGGAGSNWVYRSPVDTTFFTVEIMSKWIDSTVIDSTREKYGNGGFIAPFTGTVGACAVDSALFDGSYAIKVAAIPDKPVTFSFTRSCSQCEVWMRYTMGSTTASFSLREKIGNAKGTQYLVQACGVKWLLAGTPLPAVQRRRPFSLTGWRADANNIASWDPTDTTELQVVTPGLGIGGNGGGGVWRILSPARLPNGTQNVGTVQPTDGVAVVKLEVTRSCYSCTLQVDVYSHTVSVVTTATKLVAIPDVEGQEVQGCCRNVSLFKFTVFAADEYGDRAYTTGGPTPLSWYSAPPKVAAVALSVKVPSMPRIIAWRTEMPRETPSVTIRGSCVVNGIPYGQLCGEGTAPGKVEVEVSGGTLTDFPIEFALSDGLPVTTMLFGNQAAPRVTRGLVATALEVNREAPIQVKSGVALSIPVFGVAYYALGVGAVPTLQVASLGLTTARVYYQCAACPDCVIQGQRIVFASGRALVDVKLKWSNSSSTSVECIAFVEPADPRMATVNFTIQSSITPRYTWVFVTTPTMMVNYPPKDHKKAVVSRVFAPIELVIEAYTRFYEETSQGGYVHWNATDFPATKLLAKTQRGKECFTTTSVTLGSYGTVLRVTGHYTQLPCTVGGLVDAGLNSLFPMGTSMFNSLETSATEPYEMRLMPQYVGALRVGVNYTGLTAFTSAGHPAAVTGEKIGMLVHVLQKDGTIAVGDYHTDVLVRLSRPGREFDFIQRVKAGVVRMVIVVTEETYNRQTGAEEAYVVQIIPFNTSVPIIQHTGLPSLHVVRKGRVLQVEYRGLPMQGVQDEAWRVLDASSKWMVGYALQLRVKALDTAVPPNLVYDFTEKVTLDSANIPCVGSDQNLSWLAATCLPPLQGDQRWRAGTLPCSSQEVLPCTGSVWSSCTEPPLPGADVEYLTKHSGVLHGVLASIEGNVSTVATPVSTVSIATNQLHNKGCLVGSTADAKSVALIENGISVIGSVRFDAETTQDAYFRLVNSAVGVKYSFVRAQYVFSITFSDIACDLPIHKPKVYEVTTPAPTPKPPTSFLTFAPKNITNAPPLFVPVLNESLCDFPFPNNVMRPHVLFRLSLTINDENDVRVSAESYASIRISADCYLNDTDFRLGRIGGVSKTEVTSPLGWNTTTARNGFVNFERLAFHGTCEEAVLTFSCFGHSLDMKDACGRLVMRTYPFRVTYDNFTSNATNNTDAPPTNPPAPPLSQPTLLVNMLDLDAFTLTLQRRRFLESTLLLSLRQKSQYPDDLRSVAVAAVCTVPNVRAMHGLTEADRMSPDVCSLFNASVDFVLRDADVLVEDCGVEGCATLVEFAVIVLNPSDGVLANDVFASFTLAVNDAESPLRTQYRLDPNNALLSTSFPQQGTNLGTGNPLVSTIAPGVQVSPTPAPIDPNLWTFLQPAGQLECPLKLLIVVLLLCMVW